MKFIWGLIVIIALVVLLNTSGADQESTLSSTQDLFQSPTVANSLQSRSTTTTDQPRWPSVTGFAGGSRDRAGSSLSTNSITDYSAYGRVRVEPNSFSSTGSQIGGFTFTDGMVGNDSFSSTSNQIGGFTFTNGMVGNDSFSSTSNQIGGFTFTNGMVGNDSFSSTSNQIGGFTSTNGRVGNNSFSCTSNQIGSFTSTNCP